MPKILYIDMDNTLVDFPARLDGIDPAIRERYRGREDELPGIFALMPPMPGAIEAFHELSDALRHLHPVDGPVGQPVGMAAQGRVGAPALGHGRGDACLQAADPLAPQGPQPWRLPRRRPPRPQRRRRVPGRADPRSAQPSSPTGRPSSTTCATGPEAAYGGSSGDTDGPPPLFFFFFFFCRGASRASAYRVPTGFPSAAAGLQMVTQSASSKVDDGQTPGLGSSHAARPHVGSRLSRGASYARICRPNRCLPWDSDRPGRAR